MVRLNTCKRLSKKRFSLPISTCEQGDRDSKFLPRGSILSRKACLLNEFRKTDFGNGDEVRSGTTFLLGDGQGWQLLECGSSLPLFVSSPPLLLREAPSRTLFEAQVAVEPQTPSLAVLSLNVSGQMEPKTAGSVEANRFASTAYDEGRSARTGKSSRDTCEALEVKAFAMKHLRRQI